MTYNNDYLTLKQIANALAGVCGIVAIGDSEAYTGSFIKVCGIDMNFSLSPSGDEINIDLTSDMTGKYSLVVVFCELIKNNGAYPIYAYNTGLKLPVLTGNGS